jgi:hypothetical protein
LVAVIEQVYAAMEKVEDLARRLVADASPSRQDHPRVTAEDAKKRLLELWRARLPHRHTRSITENDELLAYR